jgi:hypothetical protein
LLIHFFLFEQAGILNHEQVVLGLVALVLKPTDDLTLGRVLAVKLCFLCDLQHDLLDGVAPFNIDDKCSILEEEVVTFGCEPHCLDYRSELA